MWVVIVVCIMIVVAVLGLSIMTLNKGYAYKQTVDPLPEEEHEDTYNREEQKES
ncbi:YtzI protein [Saliterribacillus persicus]|uniref:Tumor necrosis factor receptor superfamily member 19 n=1 Tax=Saliterribacillus persicus TaxID=930114 RepID=A0A368XYN2_9BACI|nr:YtzI protein [Saliterribacillus persicus]RCW73111.1 tumor necrosis factor receptor superfamily member 19 [Saliterribacillus persicus]